MILTILCLWYMKSADYTSNLIWKMVWWAYHALPAHPLSFHISLSNLVFGESLLASSNIRDLTHIRSRRPTQQDSQNPLKTY